MRYKELSTRVDDDRWNLPGGHARPREGPREATCREPAEETGLGADPVDLTLSTVYHGENPRTVVTYALARADADGAVEASEDVADAAFWPAAEALASPERIRDSDRERIETLFEG